jgi:hypothetical protein
MRIEPYNMDRYDRRDPSPWLALYLDQSIPIDDSAKAALLRCQDSFSRRALLPIIRPLARLSIVLVQLVRLVLPKRLASSYLLHHTIYKGLKYFVMPEANYLILRHFNIGSEILAFIADNVPGTSVEPNPLRPQKLEDLLNDTFLIHDLNIFNFIIQLNASLRAQGREIEHRKDLDFKAISDTPLVWEATPRRWHHCIDVHTAIEFYTPLYGLFLSDHDFWRASNSLQLDETIALYVARIVGSSEYIGLVNNKHPLVPISTLAAGQRLMIHGLGSEMLHAYLRRLKSQMAATPLC